MCILIYIRITHESSMITKYDAYDNLPIMGNEKTEWHSSGCQLLQTTLNTSTSSHQQFPRLHWIKLYVKVLSGEFQPILT